MSCDTYIPLIMTALEDRLDEPDRVRLAAHLDACVECRTALEEQRAVQELLAARVDAPAPPYLAARVAAHVETNRDWTDVFRWQTWTYRLAPVTAVLLVLGVLTNQRMTESPPPGDISQLAEAWTLEGVSVDEPPAFTLFWYDDVTDDTLLELILSTEADAPLRRDPE